MSNRVSPNLDFLRAVAVLLVLVQHLSLRVLHQETASGMPTSYLGLFGVLLFFVHTSLVLMYSMDRSGLRGGALARDFYIRRAFRIYPLSIVAVAAALVLHLDSNINGIAGLSYGALPHWKSIVAQFLLVQNLVQVKSMVNVLWSLPFELQMYVFLPLLFGWVRGRRVFWALMGLWGASVMAAVAQPHVSFLGWASLLRFAPCFLPGIIAFSLPRTPRMRSSLWPLFILGLIVAFTLKPVLELGWILCLALGIGIPFFQEIQSGWLRVISNRIATYSFGIYISHQFCIWFALGVLAGQPSWVRIGVLISSLVTVPILLYHAIEKPLIRAGIRVAERGREKSVAALPAAA